MIYLFPILSLLSLLQGQEPPVVREDYRLAENAARKLLDALGVPTMRVAVLYRNLGRQSRVMGSHRHEQVKINVDKYPRNVRTVFHEFWHEAQERWEGRRNYVASYRRYPYHANPYEREARLVADRLGTLYTSLSGLPLYRTGQFVNEAAPMMRSLVPEIRSIWAEVPDASVQTQRRLNALEKVTSVLADRRAPTTRGRVLEATGNFASGAAAYLLAECLLAVPTLDAEKIGEAACRTIEPACLSDMAVFGIVSTAVSTAVASTVSTPWTRFFGAVAPTTAGIMAATAGRGRFHPGETLRSAGVVLGTGSIVHLLVGAGPQTRVTGFLFSVGKTALTLFFARKIEGWIRDRAEGSPERFAEARPPVRGARPTVETMGGVGPR